jgi:hypothetical protein
MLSRWVSIVLWLVGPVCSDDAPSPTAATHDSQLTTHQDDETVSCGLRAAYLLLERLGQPVPLDQIQAASPVPADGPMSFADLQRLFDNLGFAAEGYRMPLERLDQPVIAYLPHPDGKVGHFVVVEPVGVDGQGSRVEGRGPEPAGPQPSALSPQLFLVLDPLGQPVKVPAARVSQAWDGRVLVVYPRGTSANARGGESLDLSLRWIVIGVAVCVAGVVGAVALRRLYANELEFGAVRCSSDWVKNLRPRKPAEAEEAAESRTGTRWIAMVVAGVVAVGALGYVAYRLRASDQGDSGPGPGRTGMVQGTPVRVLVQAWGTTLVLQQGTEFDFGQVKSGDRLSHTFIAKNVGRAPVPLSELRMNCACNAQVEYVPMGPAPPAPLPRVGEARSPSPPAPLPRAGEGRSPSPPTGEAKTPSPQPSPPMGEGVCGPGESCGIRLSMKAAGFGPQSKTIPFTIASDGLSETLFKLKLTYRVAWIEQAQFVPERLDVGQLPCTAREATRELQLVLVGPPDEPEPEVLDVTSDSPAVRAAVGRREVPEVNARSATMIPAQRAIYWVQARIDPGELALGQFHTHVTARTSIGEAKLHLRGEICRPIIATPASLLVERSRPTATTYRVRLRNVAEDPVQIVAAESSVKGVSCQIDSDQHEVIVQVEADADLDAQPVVEIHFQAGDAEDMVRVPLVLF